MSKKSFLLHNDALDVLDELTDEQAGMLFKAIRDYQNGKEVALEGLMKAIFIPFKNRIDADREKYESVCERNKANGSKGGRPKENKPKKTQKTQSDNYEPKKADTDPDTDTDFKPPNPLSDDKPPDREKPKINGVFGNGFSGGYRVENHLSDDAWLDARAHAPGWDIHHLASIYNEGVGNGRDPPRYPNKAFPAWCKKYTKGLPP